MVISSNSHKGFFDIYFQSKDMADFQNLQGRLEPLSLGRISLAVQVGSVEIPIVHRYTSITIYP